jgi:hypothetical protein
MKKNILLAFSLLMLFAFSGTAQNSLASDQNPNYMVSQARYMKMADSINAWHSTTPQETYKAIDYLEDKREARADRKAWRHELRMERARYGGWYNDGYNNYNNGYYNNYSYPYNSYNSGYYYNRFGGYRNNFGNYFWNTLPLAATAGLWWCR